MTAHALSGRSSRACATVAGVVLGLSGCASVPQAPEAIRVQVPVPCVGDPPVRPSMLTDAQLLALDDYGLVIALAQDRRVRQGYHAELEAVVAGCR